MRSTYVFRKSQITLVEYSSAVESECTSDVRGRSFFPRKKEPKFRSQNPAYERNPRAGKSLRNRNPHDKVDSCYDQEQFRSLRQSEDQNTEIAKLSQFLHRFPLYGIPPVSGIPKSGTVLSTSLRLVRVVDLRFRIPTAPMERQPVLLQNQGLLHPRAKSLSQMHWKGKLCIRTQTIFGRTDLRSEIHRGQENFL